MPDPEIIRVRRFRQILLWPVQLMPLKEGAQIQRHWEHLGGPNCVWRELVDEFTQNPADFKERHYSEFTAFLPYVQRFLYGEGERAGGGPGYGASPIRVFRRNDVAKVRITLGGGAPQDVTVTHIDLYFFYDIDVAILVVEIAAENLELTQIQDLLYRFGRAYPSFWNPDGSGGHCPRTVEWLAADGTVLASSDFDDKEKYLAFVCRHRAPYIAAHWAFLLKPLTLHHCEEREILHYRQLEYQRMPLLAYLSVDDPTSLTRADWVRLGLATEPGDEDGTLPFAESYLSGFEQRYCYDRYWNPGPGLSNTRTLCCGHAMVMVGRDGDPFYTDLESGLQGQFRHQYFLLGLIVHFHRAALLMMSDRLVVAVSRLDIMDVDSVKIFKRSIRQQFEIFLRFNHRYWFHDISRQEPLRALFRLWSGHLGTECLFAEVRDEVRDMSDYLDSDGLRRQANSVLRLTVVTVVSMVGTLVSGFLGMNLIAAADEPLGLRLVYFLMALAPTVALIMLSIAKSKHLADLLESLSDERRPLWNRLILAELRRRHTKS